MTTKKVAKKNLTKFPDTSASKKKAVKDDGVYWVLSERSKLFTWTPIKIFKTRAAADYARFVAENRSIYGGLGYKVNRVVMN